MCAADKSIERMINIMLLCDLLKNSDQLKKAMIKACEILLPGGLSQQLRDCMNTYRVPDKSEVSRFRLTIDVAVMLKDRCRHYEEYRANIMPVRHLTWDSSPQFNRDYESVLVQTIECTDILPALQLARDIQVTATTRIEELLPYDHEDHGVLQEHIEDMQKLRKMIKIHALPSVCIGFGASSFEHKLSALVHAVRLEHFNAASFAHWWASLAGALSDDGTERVLADILPFQAQQACRWFEDTPGKDIEIIAHQGGRLCRTA